jgi:hypothetical protein
MIGIGLESSETDQDLYSRNKNQNVGILAFIVKIANTEQEIQVKV